MSIPFTRDDYRTYSIDPATLADHVRDFIAALESDDPGLATISDGWNRFRYIIAPDPGGSHWIIERSDLSDDVKDRLQAVRKIGMEGTYHIREDKRPVLAMLRGCLEAPKRDVPKRKKGDGIARALTILMKHPEWDDATIAGKAKISASVLSRSPQFQTARSASKGIGIEAISDD